MTTRNNGGLSEWMEPELDDKAITKQWLGVRDRMESMRRKRFIGFFALTALSASAAAWLLTATPAAPPTPRVAVVPSTPVVSPTTLHITTEATARDVRLDDGSQLNVGPFSGVEGTATMSDVHLALARGNVFFDVSHVVGRPFVVDAGPVTVRVVGTRFRVTRDGDRVTVQVERGRVQVQSPAGATFVGAGESWPSATAAAEVRPRDRAQAIERAQEPVPQEEAVSPAEMLFAEATAARRAGRYDAAATGYSSLIEQFPRDGRASLASYELGRMYLDAMHQPGRAIAPLRRAISSAPRGASYREDAMARLVAAYSRSNQTEACMQARDRYLAEYASGLHRTAVSRSCAVE